MAKRTSLKKRDTSEVQGEGSYVVLSSLTVKEVRKARKVGRDPECDAFEEGIKLLARHIVAWDWVDDEGKPLPLPKDSPGVMDELTNEESELLANLLIGDDAKN